MKHSLSTALFASLAVALFTGADWRQFRGTFGNAVALNADPPVEWDDESGKGVAWKIDLPGRGLSGPIVVGDRVFITASSGYRQDRLHVLCFDTGTGEELWQRQFWATGRTQTHNKMAVATPTPASDGERVFAFFSSNDLACLDLEGNLLWFRGLGHDFPNASNSLGMSSSPVVVGDTVVVQVESDAESFATGVDANTGVSRWRIDRPRKANWSSPSVLNAEDPKTARVLLQSAKGVTAVEPKTGRVDWEFVEGASTIPSSVVGNGLVYVPTGGGLTALRPIAESESPEIVWKTSRLAPRTPSPLVYEGRVYALGGSSLTCGDAKTGDRLWQLRLGGKFSATPTAAAGRLYFFTEEGDAYVVKPGEKKGEVLSENKLGETILCTPAISGDAIYVRSDGHLWKLADRD